MSALIDSKADARCVNLRELFGQRYQLAYDPSYYAEHGRNSRVDDPWLQIVLCHHGHIFPWGGRRLAASTDSPGAIANRLAVHDCCPVEQLGDDGVTVSFDVADFRAVAAIIRPRGRQRLDPVRREAFIAAGRAHRYSDGANRDFGPHPSV